MPPPTPRKPWYRILYIQVIIAVILGIAVGRLFPAFGKSLKPLGDGFINLVKMMIAPIIFCTVVHGIASMTDLKRLGRVGAKTLLYFEVVSTLALLIGLLVVNVLQPGAGLTPAGQTFHVDTSTATGTTQAYTEKARTLSTTEFVLNIIPKTFLGAFVSGDLLQVLLIAILVACAIAFMGERGQPLLHVIDYGTQVFFGVMHIVVKAAPIGAFGAMGYTVGSHGIGALNKLLALMAGFYLTAGFFVIVVLGGIAWFSGFSIFRFLNHIKDELLLVLGTSSSETALPGMIEKMQRLGCSKSTVGLVIPTGYSFNLDGTNIYMTMAAVFLAQATNTPLDLRQQLSLLLIAMLTSKGSSGVTGAGFVTLAATLQAVPAIPVEALALLVGIDRFMSECRALTKSTVGLVIPTGYSFNLDGTNIYMTMAAVFLAQATNTPLDLRQQLSLLLIAMLTSKGSSGVTGAGFVTLAATLQAVPAIPVEALALLVGIDRFMSECRALTNLVGNGVATVVISRWENEITPAQLQANLLNPPPLSPPARGSAEEE